MPCDVGPTAISRSPRRTHPATLSVELARGGDRRPCRSGTELLLPRRSAVALLFRSTLAQDTVRDRRTQPVALGRPVPVGAIGGQQPSGRLILMTTATSVSWSGTTMVTKTWSRRRTHRRTVELDRRRCRLEIDRSGRVTQAAHGIRMTFHLGPAVRPTWRVRSAAAVGVLPARRSRHLPPSRRAPLERSTAVSSNRSSVGFRPGSAPRADATLLGIGSCSEVTGISGACSRRWFDAWRTYLRPSVHALTFVASLP